MERSSSPPVNDNEQAPVWTQNDALAEIGIMRNLAMQEGSVDSEYDELSRLIIEVRNGNVAPSEAVEKARGLMQSRQSYH